MNRLFCLAISMLIAVQISAATGTFDKDSLGIEIKDGKKFILHKVEAKETFYSISKRYNVSIDEIVKYNQESLNGLKIDQIINVPLSATADQQVKSSTTSPNAIEKREISSGTVIHQVLPSETLFSISRNYNVGLEEIKKLNGLSGNDLFIGQELIIKPGNSALDKGLASSNPGTTKAATPEKTTLPVDKSSDALVVHTVETSQTLFSISKLYNVPVEDIKRWNHLDGSELTVGQKLTVKKKSIEEVQSEENNSKKPGLASSDNTLPKENFENYESSPQRTSKAESESPIEKPKTVPTVVKNSSGNKVVELGFAEVIEGTSDTKKFRALHKSAPVGTIIQVKNEMNNLSVFVRVLGTLPNTSDNDKVLIKLTKAAYDKLGAIDSKFPVEISYVP